MADRKRFKKSKENPIDRPDITQVVFREMNGETPTGFKITAEASGIKLGESDWISGDSQLDEVAYFISEAYKAHLQLRRDLRSKLGMIN